MPSFKLTATLLFVGALVLFQAGCLGPSKNPPTRFYVLSSLHSGETAIRPVADLADVAIGVGPVRIPAKIDRPQLVTRSTRNEIRLAGLAEWGDPLGVSFTRALAENLALLLNTEKVSIFPWLKPTRTDYQVTVDVVEFIGAPGENARLRAWWTIFGDDGRTEVLKRYSRFELEVSGDDIAAMVQAQSLLVGSFSRQIAETLKALSQKKQ